MKVCVKKLLVLCLAISMLLPLVACGKDPTPTVPGATTTAPVATTTAPSGEVKYNEAPALAALVKDGKLPPIEERLPMEPCVVNVPVVGTYGGVFSGGGFGPAHGQLDTEAFRFVGLLQIEPDLETFTPNILKDYEVNDDYTEYTLYFREGMKWSDGEPFTADDMIFWYEDILLNKELTPSVGTAYKSGGEVMLMEKIDDYTVKVSFAAPLPAFRVSMAKSFWTTMYAPKHYLKQWHIDHNPEAKALAAKENYESWFQAFLFHMDRGQAQQDTKRPTLMPWTLQSIDTVGNKYYERNPYYWKVEDRKSVV